METVVVEHPEFPRVSWEDDMDCGEPRESYVEWLRRRLRRRNAEMVEEARVRLAAVLRDSPASPRDAVF